MDRPRIYWDLLMLCSFQCRRYNILGQVPYFLALTTGKRNRFELSQKLYVQNYPKQGHAGMSQDHVRWFIFVKAIHSRMK